MGNPLLLGQAVSEFLIPAALAQGPQADLTLTGPTVAPQAYSSWCDVPDYHSPVPCQVADASFAKSVHGPTGPWRMGSYEDAPALLQVLRSGSHEQILTEMPGNVINDVSHWLGMDDVHIPTTYPISPEYAAGLSLLPAFLAARGIIGNRSYIKTALAALSAGGMSAMIYALAQVAPESIPVLVGLAGTLYAMHRINEEYIRKPLEPGFTGYKGGLGFILYWFIVYGAAYVTAHNSTHLGQIFAPDGFHPEKIILNRQVLQNYFFYWGLTSPIWGNIGFISMRSAGPMTKLFSWKQTRKMPIFNSGEIVEATVDRLRVLFQDDKTADGKRMVSGRVQASFTLEADELVSTDLAIRVAGLGEDIQAKMSWTLDKHGKLFQMPRELRRLSEAGVQWKLTVEESRPVKNTTVAAGERLRTGSILRSGSPEANRLIAEGLAQQSRRNRDHVVVTHKDGAVLQAEAPVLRGYILRTNEFTTIDENRWHQYKEGYAKFTFEFTGVARDILYRVSEAVGGRPCFQASNNISSFGPIRAALQGMRRWTGPAVMTVTITEPQKDADFDNLVRILAPIKYVTRLSSNPKVPLSRPVVASLAGNTVDLQISAGLLTDGRINQILADAIPGIDTLATDELGNDIPGTYAMPRSTIKETYRPWRHGWTGSFVRITVPKQILTGIFANPREPHNQAFIQKIAVLKRAVAVLPNPLVIPSDLAVFAPAQKAALLVGAGSVKDPFEITFRDEDPDVSTNPIVRAASVIPLGAYGLIQSPRFGRLRNLLAVAFSGAVLSGSAGALMKYGQGYSEEAALKTFPQSLVTRTGNMVTAPAITTFTGIPGYNMWWNYFTGMHYIAGHTILVDVSKREGEFMQVQNLVVETRNQQDVDLRLDRLEELRTWEPLVDSRREEVLAMKGAHLVTDGYVEEGDAKILREQFEHYKNQKWDSMPAARFLSALAFDPALTYLVQMDSNLFAKMREEAQKRKSAIEEVLKERGLTIANLEPGWFDTNADASAGGGSGEDSAG